MQVRYAAERYLVPSVDGGGGDFLVDGSVYDVIEIGMDPDRHVWFRIENRDGTPALYDSRCFTLTGEELAPDWVAQLHANGSLTLGPRPFLASGFWERYFDRVPDAIEVYQRERRKDV